MIILKIYVSNFSGYISCMIPLNLKTNTGSVGKGWLDLPFRRTTPEPYYFRQSESQRLPPSYRTGLVFFAAIMIMAVFGLTGIHAQTLAESKQSWLAMYHQTKQQQQLQDFMSLWENQGAMSLMDQLEAMGPAAQRALASLEDPAANPDPELEQVGSFLKAFQAGLPQLKTLLGGEEPQRILVFIQDPTERRATGGTLSGGVEILLDTGKVVTWKPFLSQDYDNLLSVNIPPPAELANITDRWGLSTANSFLDMPQSAEKMHWFWQRGAHSSADAIIIVNSTALEKILAVSGVSTNLSEQWTELRLGQNQDELKNLASSSVESLLSMAKNPNITIAAWPTINAIARQKQMMIFSTDPQLQSKLEDFQISAALPSPGSHEDTLMIASIGTEPNSTDQFIEEHHRLDTAISSDGKIRHWLKINRRNLSQDTAHRSLTRILVPLGSRMTTADGLDMSNISVMNTDRFTVWSFNLSLSPEETKELALSYSLPWNFDTTSVDNYRLTLLKQAGTNPMPFQHHLKLPAELTIFQQLPEEEISVLDRDIHVAVVAGKNP